MKTPSSCRVLVVEDHADGRFLLCLLLKAYGFHVEEAGDGRLGVKRALTWQPDVAVVDIDLPHLNGYEVARQVKAALGGRIRLIALTAYGQPADRQRAAEAGFDLHLTKPADPPELVRHLRAVVAAAPEKDGGCAPTSDGEPSFMVEGVGPCWSA